MASKHITSDMVEISEFPQLAVKYRVRGVPHTVINEQRDLIGLQPDLAFARAVREAGGA